MECLHDCIYKSRGTGTHYSSFIEVMSVYNIQIICKRMLTKLVGQKIRRTTTQSLRLTTQTWKNSWECREPSQTWLGGSITCPICTWIIDGKWFKGITKANDFEYIICWDDSFTFCLLSQNCMHLNSAAKQFLSYMDLLLESKIQEGASKQGCKVIFPSIECYVTRCPVTSNPDKHE